MLSYLAECSVNNVRVVAYEDHAEGTMDMRDGRVRFVGAVLRPRVTVDATSDPQLAHRLHERAQEVCFIANSVNFPVRHEITVVKAE
jgi:organic hydroperoxide reductase OsmC/OhrA